MGSCFKFGKRKNTYTFSDPYSKSTPDGKYQLQGNYDFSTANYAVPAGIPTGTAEATQRNELKATTEENGVSPPMQNSEVTTTTTTTVTTNYTTKTEDEPRVNGDIAGDVAATAAAAVVVAGTVEAVKSGDDEDKLVAEELARATHEPERAENIYTYETPGDENSQHEAETTEENYETIPDSSPLAETVYQADAYEVAVSSSSEQTTVILGQEDDTVDVSESGAYYSAPAEEDYYSTVAEPTDDDDAGVIVTTQSVIIESQPSFDEQHSHTGISVSNRNSDELQSKEGEPGMEDATEEAAYSTVEKTTVITTSSTEESTANTTSRLSADYDNEPGSYTTTVTTETTYYNVGPSQINDSTEQLSENFADDSQRTSVTVNYTTDASDLHPQLTTTNSLECQTPTSGQFARNVDDYILS